MEKSYTAPKAQRSGNRFLKGAIVGGAVGLGIGGIGGYFVARKQLLKKAKEDCRKAYKKGYSKGEDDATKEAMEWIDQNIIVADSEKAEDIQKAIAEHESKTAETREDIANRIADMAMNGASKEELAKEIESSRRIIDAEKTAREHELLKKNVRELFGNGHTINEVAERLHIPESTVLNIIKESQLEDFANSDRPAVHVEKISDRQKAAEMLNDAYNEAVVESAGDPEDWDLSIDGEEAAVRSEEREKYLDMIDRYQGHAEDAPMHISRKEFEEECYLEKDWVTYYAGDNVFASDHDADSPMDGFANFGVVNGNDLFETRYLDDEGNDDPNIVYIRNFGLNTVYEVTRTAGSYADLKSGDAFLYEKPETAEAGM